MISDDPNLRHRTASTVLDLRGADGAPLADTEVTVEQTRHDFGFGNIGFDFIPLANGEQEAPTPEGESFGGAAVDRLPRLAELWLDVFNTATLPFYWGAFEPRWGEPDTQRLRRTAEWFRERGVALKGHPLVWHTVTAPWLLELPVEEIERVQRERIRREVGDFAGLIDTWDAINETVIMPVFENGDNGITRLAQQLGRLEITRLAFEEAQATNPDAVLLINDFDLSPAYEEAIERALEAGIRIDAIGLQTHMHQGFRGEAQLTAIADRFARFGLPLHFTETTLVSGDLMPPEIVDLNDYQVDDWPSTPEGEARQADEVERHYRTLFAHPAVESITYWGLTDDGAWLGAPCGLVRADATPKPAYERLRSLVKEEWWMRPTTLRTDAAGRVELRGARGDYRVHAGDLGAELTLGASGRETPLGLA